MALVKLRLNLEVKPAPWPYSSLQFKIQFITKALVYCLNIPSLMIIYEKRKALQTRYDQKDGPASKGECM